MKVSKSWNYMEGSPESAFGWMMINAPTEVKYKVLDYIRHIMLTKGKMQGKWMCTSSEDWDEEWYKKDMQKDQDWIDEMRVYLTEAASEYDVIEINGVLYE